MRKLIVTLIADLGNNRQLFLKLGETIDEKTQVRIDPLDISVKGHKYLSPAKDEFTVVVKNIPMTSDAISMVQIKDIPFRYITIEAGYESASMQIFNGYIVYISSKREDNGKTVSMYITCSGSYTFNALQGKTFTLKGGVDYKTALLFAARMSGIYPYQLSLSDTLRHKRLKSDTTFDGSIISMLIELQNQDRNLFVHCDYSGSQTKFQVWDATMFITRQIHLTPENIILTNGFPTIEDQGVRFTCLPFFNFKPGDEVIFDDDSYINRSIESLSSYMSSPFPDIYVGAASPLETDSDKIKEIEATKGHYNILDLNYNLQNRGNAFEIQLKCYSKSFYTTLAQQWS